MADAEGESLDEVIRRAILDELKKQYEETEDWGHTTGLIQGIRVKGKWFKPRVEQVLTPVNNGLWQRYVVTLVDPLHLFKVRLADIKATAPGRFAFSLFLEAKVHGEAHIERWRLGVKMLNVSAAGDATIAARIDCDLGISFESGKLITDVVLDPRVTAVDLRLVDLDVQRFSRLHGDAVHEIGDSFTRLVARELDRREGKIVEKANAAIEKRRDRLRFSLDQFLKSGWSKLQAKMALKPAAEAPH